MLTKRHYSLRIETPVNGLMSCGLTQEWLTGGQAAGGETCRLMSSSRGATVCWQSGLEPWTNKHRSPFLIRPCSGQKLFQKAAFLRHGVSDRLCRWTGRRWTRLAVRLSQSLRKWLEKLSSKSADGEKAALWEMNVTGKQQPELIERPASLLVPTSASNPAHFGPFDRADQSVMSPWDVLCAGAVTKSTRAVLFFDVADTGNSRLPLKKHYLGHYCL